MTLIMAAPVQTNWAIATDSAAATPSGVTLGEKAIQGVGGHALLTWFGSFDMSPTALSGDPSGLQSALGDTLPHDERVIRLISVLNAHPNVHSQGSSAATCLLFGFRDGQQVVDAFESLHGGPWVQSDPIANSILAGYLEPLGRTPNSGIAKIGRQFGDDGEFREWASEQVETADQWLKKGKLTPAILMPTRHYMLTPPPVRAA